MKREDAWRLIAGSVALVLVLVLLLSTPSMIQAKSVAVVDTELNEQGPSAQRVLTKLDFADPAQLQQVPAQLGAWHEERQYAWDDVATLLNTKVLLSRDYAREGVFQPVNLLIVESTNVSSFHPAPVCYRAQGWTVDDGATVTVPVANASWAQPEWLGKGEPYVFNGSLAAKLLTATKSNATTGNVTQQRFALYVYLKKQDWAVTHDVTWVRIEIAVPPGTSSDAAAPVLRDLLAAAVPEVFSFEAGSEPTLAETMVHHWGYLGGVGIFGLVAVPAGVIGLSWRKMRAK